MGIIYLIYLASFVEHRVRKLRPFHLLVSHNDYFCVSNMILDDGEAARKEVGDSASNQKTKQDSTYIRQQNVLAKINEIQKIISAL